MASLSVRKGRVGVLYRETTRGGGVRGDDMLITGV